MDLDNKLKGMPKVHYFNLDNRTDRRDWMEKQFSKYGIDYERISGTKYLASKNKEWKHLLLNPSEYKLLVPIAANAISHLDFLKRWLKESDDPYVLLMEDDYDLSLIEYWHFDWNYMMEHVPYDWDCLLLGFENPSGIPFHLHPIEPGHDFGPVLVRREYVEKIVDLHCVGDQYNLNHSNANAVWNRNKDGSGSGTVDYFMVHGGRTYCLPLITINANFGSFENNSVIQRYHRQDGDINARNTYYFWWRHQRDLHSLEDFFTYGHNSKYMKLRPEVFGTYDMTGKSYEMYGESYLNYYRKNSSC